MRSAFFLLPGIPLALSSCGRGGATLENNPLWVQIYTKVQFFLDKKAVRLYY